MENFDDVQILLVTGVNQQLGISNEWFAIGDSLILTVLSQVRHVAFVYILGKPNFLIYRVLICLVAFICSESMLQFWMHTF